ncbi:MAG: ABC transporter permease [Gracilimonas sp.]|nr:ABC transporter permease [Gracilimonas sp.]
MLYLKLAWRNIWRNKRRTFITMLSVIVAVMLSSAMRTMNEGSYEQMIDNTVGLFTGYAQIHQKGYWDDKTLEYTLTSEDSLFRIIDQTSGISEAVPRLESYALVAGEKQSRAAMVIGIDPEKEKSLSDPQSRIISGSYFEDIDERSVLLGTDLMQRLKLQVGDSLVMIGQGFRGQSAAGLYEIKGTVRFPNPELNKSLVMLPLETAQYFLAAPERLTGISLIMEDPDDAAQIVKYLSGKLSNEEYEVMDWKELMPELVQAIESDRGSGFIIIMILYVVVGFGDPWNGLNDDNRKNV